MDIAAILIVFIIGMALGAVLTVVALHQRVATYLQGQSDTRRKVSELLDEADRRYKQQASEVSITIARDMEIIDDENGEALPLTRYTLGDLSLEVFDTPDPGTGNDLYFEFPRLFDAIPVRAQLRLVRAFLTSPEIGAIIDGPDPKRPERKGPAQ